jgi:hypothetical protein
MSQDWFDRYVQPGELYDPEGFDSYGYDKDDYDRAGNQEHEYYSNDADVDSTEDYNCAYDRALDVWGFDGTKPAELA